MLIMQWTAGTGEIPVNSFTEDFSGSISPYWEQFTPNTSSVTTSGGKAVFTMPSRDDGPSLFPHFVPTGDFDFRIESDVTGVTVTNSADSVFSILLIFINGYAYQINHGISNALRVASYTSDPTNTGFSNQIITTGTQNEMDLRITRVGTTITAYYRVTGTGPWTQFPTTATNVSTAPVTFLRLDTWGNGTGPHPDGTQTIRMDNMWIVADGFESRP